MKEAKPDPAKPEADLGPERRPRLECQAKPRRHLRSPGVHQGAGRLQFHQASVSLAARRTLQSKVAVKPSELSGVGRHRRPASVRVSVAAAQGEASHLATASLARHLLVQVLAKHQAGKDVDNLAFRDLQPHRQRAQGRTKHEVEGKEEV